MFRLAVTNKTKTILEDVKRIICIKQWSFVEISRDSKLFAINMCIWHDAVHEYDDEKRNKLTWVKHYWTCFIESERIAATTIVGFRIRSPDLRLDSIDSKADVCIHETNLISWLFHSTDAANRKAILLFRFLLKFSFRKSWRCPTRSFHRDANTYFNLANPR